MAIQLCYKDEEEKKDNEEMDNRSLDGGGPDQDDDDEEDAIHGVYVEAYCSGVNEILQVYKETLLAIEREYLSDRSLTLIQIKLRLALYQ